MTSYARVEGHHATFRGLESGPVAITVHSTDWDTLAVAATVVETGENHLEIPLGITNFTVLVTNSDGDPLPDTQVDIFAPESNRGFSLYGATDPRGEIEFPRAPYEKLRAVLHHPDYGYRTEVPVELGPGDNELVELELPDPVGLRLRLVDGTVPLPGVQIRLLNPSEQYYVGFFTSDDAGLIEEAGFTDSPFVVRVNQGRYWPARAEVRGSLAGETTDVQIRRLGDLELEVRSTKGLAVRACPIELHSLEFDADAADWAAAGLLDAPDGLVTDAAGRLRLEGLPHGDYRWTVLDAAGAATTGTATVDPWAGTSVTVLVE